MYASIAELKLILELRASIMATFCIILYYEDQQSYRMNPLCYCRHWVGWNKTFELTALKPGNKLMDAETRRRADGGCRGSDNYL